MDKPTNFGDNMRIGDCITWKDWNGENKREIGVIFGRHGAYKSWENMWWTCFTNGKYRNKRVLINERHVVLLSEVT